MHLFFSPVGLWDIHTVDNIDFGTRLSCNAVSTEVYKWRWWLRMRSALPPRHAVLRTWPLSLETRILGCYERLLCAHHYHMPHIPPGASLWRLSPPWVRFFVLDTAFLGYPDSGPHASVEYASNFVVFTDMGVFTILISVSPPGGILLGEGIIKLGSFLVLTFFLQMKQENTEKDGKLTWMIYILFHTPPISHEVSLEFSLEGV